MKIFNHNNLGTLIKDERAIFVQQNKCLFNRYLSVANRLRVQSRQSYDKFLYIRKSKKKPWIVINYCLHVLYLKWLENTRIAFFLQKNFMLYSFLLALNVKSSISEKNYRSNKSMVINLYVISDFVRVKNTNYFWFAT